MACLRQEVLLSMIVEEVFQRGRVCGTERVWDDQKPLQVELELLLRRHIRATNRAEAGACPASG
jgi:hypothetical protein